VLLLLLLNGLGKVLHGLRKMLRELVLIGLSEMLHGLRKLLLLHKLVLLMHGLLHKLLMGLLLRELLLIGKGEMLNGLREVRLPRQLLNLFLLLLAERH
jgi:hypothetical protein